MKKLMIYIILILSIAVVGNMLYNRIQGNKLKKELSMFNELVMNATEIYMGKHEQEYLDFKELGDRVEINVQKLIDDDILKPDTKNPTNKKFSEIIVRLTIETDKTIKYEVLD